MTFEDPDCMKNVFKYCKFNKDIQERMEEERREDRKAKKKWDKEVSSNMFILIIFLSKFVCVVRYILTIMVKEQNSICFHLA